VLPWSPVRAAPSLTRRDQKPEPVLLSLPHHGRKTASQQARHAVRHAVLTNQLPAPGSFEAIHGDIICKLNFHFAFSRCAPPTVRPTRIRPYQQVRTAPIGNPPSPGHAMTNAFLVSVGHHAHTKIHVQAGTETTIKFVLSITLVRVSLEGNPGRPQDRARSKPGGVFPHHRRDSRHYRPLRRTLCHPVRHKVALERSRAKCRA